eukprot:g2964.t1
MTSESSDGVQVDEKTGFRTWNVDYYAKKAKKSKSLERIVPSSDKTSSQENDDDGQTSATNSTNQLVQNLVQPRSKGELDLSSKVNEKQIVNVETAEGGDQGGFYCATCQKLCRDSASWIEHLNSRWHQVNMGYSMRVKNSSIDDVKSRLKE